MNLIERIFEFTARLEKANIRYAIGGSVAAGVWGEPRQTNDVDVEIWLSDAEVSSFMGAFSEGYLISSTEVELAVGSEERFVSIQVLDTDVLLKFDCFLLGRSPTDEDTFSKTDLVKLNGGYVRVASAEHIVLQKLRWFDLGNRASERQWRDMIAVVRTTSNFDWKLLNGWAKVYGLEALVEELQR